MKNFFKFNFEPKVGYTTFQEIKEDVYDGISANVNFNRLMFCFRKFFTERVCEACLFIEPRQYPREYRAQLGESLRPGDLSLRVEGRRNNISYEVHGSYFDLGHYIRVIYESPKHNMSVYTLIARSKSLLAMLGCTVKRDILGKFGVMNDLRFSILENSTEWSFGYDLSTKLKKADLGLSFGYKSENMIKSLGTCCRYNLNKNDNLSWMLELGEGNALILGRKSSSNKSSFTTRFFFRFDDFFSHASIVMRRKFKRFSCKSTIDTTLSIGNELIFTPSVFFEAALSTRFDMLGLGSGPSYAISIKVTE